MFYFKFLFLSNVPFNFNLIEQLAQKNILSITQTTLLFCLYTYLIFLVFLFVHLFIYFCNFFWQRLISLTFIIFLKELSLVKNKFVSQYKLFIINSKYNLFLKIYLFLINLNYIKINIYPMHYTSQNTSIR